MLRHHDLIRGVLRKEMIDGKWVGYSELEIDKFFEYHLKRPEVWQMFKQYCFQSLESGATKWSARAIMHRIRWEGNIEKGDEQFAVNHTLSPMYARAFVVHYPKYETYFSFHKIKGCPSILRLQNVEEDNNPLRRVK